MTFERTLYNMCMNVAYQQIYKPQCGIVIHKTEVVFVEKEESEFNPPV